jgi:hypothetical protein
VSDQLPTLPPVPPPPESPAAPGPWGAPGPVEPATAPAPRRRRGLLAGAVALAVALVAGAGIFLVTQGGGSAEARPLALRFVAGDSRTYDIHMTMAGSMSGDLVGELPVDMEMSEVVTWEVTSVDDEGLATVEVKVSEVSGSVSGMEIPAEAAQMPPTEMVIAPDGRIVSLGGISLGGLGDMPAAGFPGMGQLTPILPDEGTVVAPGDTWTKEFTQDIPFGDGAITVATTSRYDRNEDVNGREAAVIVSEMTIPIDFSFDLDDLAELGAGFGATGPAGLDALSGASMSYEGGVTVTQTSFVDLEAKELLRSESAGDLDLAMSFAGVPGMEGDMTIAGAFTQEFALR